MASTFPLRRVTRQATNTFIARWRLTGGAETEHSLTEQEYRALALKGAGAPPNRTGDAGATWLLAYECWTFDTASGGMEPGDITDAWPGRLALMLPSLRRSAIKIPLAEFRGSLDRLSTLRLDAGRVARLSVSNGVATVAD